MKIKNKKMKRSINAIDSRDDLECQSKKAHLSIESIDSPTQVSEVTSMSIDSSIDSSITVPVTSHDFIINPEDNKTTTKHGYVTPNIESPDYECEMIDRGAVNRKNQLDFCGRRTERKSMSAPTVAEGRVEAVFSKPITSPTFGFVPIQSGRYAAISFSSATQSLPKRSGSSCLSSLADMSDMSAALDEITVSESATSSEIFQLSDDSDNDSDSDHSIGLMI